MNPTPEHQIPKQESSAGRESAELLPCPFCGSPAKRSTRTYQDGEVTWADGLGSPGPFWRTEEKIHCTNLKCYAQIINGSVAQWNTRTSVEASRIASDAYRIENEALRGELKAQQTLNRALLSAANEKDAQLQSQATELERLRKDAERMDWLEHYEEGFANIDRVTSINTAEGVKFNGRRSLREAIDAAISAAARTGEAT